LIWLILQEQCNKNIKMEEKILKIIFENHIYSKDTVKRIYERTKSFDKTIFILNIATATAINPEQLLNFI